MELIFIALFLLVGYIVLYVFVRVRRGRR